MKDASPQVIIVTFLLALGLTFTAVAWMTMISWGIAYGYGIISAAPSFTEALVMSLPSSAMLSYSVVKGMTQS